MALTQAELDAFTGTENIYQHSFGKIHYTDGVKYGCMKESEQTQIFMQSDEALLLQEFLDYLQSVNPEVLLTYNGMGFDLPFIITRLNALKIEHPFKQARNPRRIPSAQVFGTPIEVNEIFSKNTNHVDVYICVLRWDLAAALLYFSIVQ